MKDQRSARGSRSLRMARSCNLGNDVFARGIKAWVEDEKIPYYIEVLEIFGLRTMGRLIQP